ncbi:MAG: 3-phosphoshikimate 1-carboxyvinyltransferase [Actinomycetaceae bacterium]|nr:3-phosphoshikimate 1-carboxyvinyltransferase [Actinomycetaceae bacterium]MDY6082792.1 3-phosphoshikimate 1-carboxyvinyltransferase [Actinomycetaceae bacterium]
MLIPKPMHAQEETTPMPSPKPGLTLTPMPKLEKPKLDNMRDEASEETRSAEALDRDVLVVEPGTAHGRVRVPPSKSVAHRLIVAASLATGRSYVRGVDLSDDIRATLACSQALGAQIDIVEGSGSGAGNRDHRCDVTIEGVGAGVRDSALLSSSRLALPFARHRVLECGESGSTLRFFIPIALLSPLPTEFRGAASLFARPLGVYEELCARQGLVWQRREHSLTVQGSLKPGNIQVAADVSSQFISGLLFALPFLESDSVLTLAGSVESRSYIDLTRQVLSFSGVQSRWEDSTHVSIPGAQHAQSVDEYVPGDFSQAAVFFAMNLLGSDIDIQGLPEHTRQGDAAFADLAHMLTEPDPIIDLSQTPDLGPVLFVLAAMTNGAQFVGVRRLRVKESDRVSTMLQELSACGVQATESQDAVTIVAGIHPPSRTLCAHHDHRVAMALALVLTKFGGRLRGFRCVKKSYPGFWQDIAELGIRLHVQPR